MQGWWRVAVGQPEPIPTGTVPVNQAVHCIRVLRRCAV